MSVHVLRTSAFPQNHIPALDETVTDPAKAAALYAAVQALPPPPKDAGQIFCPLDLGVAYHLTFSRGQTPVSSAVVQAGGCEAVTLNGHARWALNQTRFWAAFASALGVSRSVMFPPPQSSGPYAPQTDLRQP